MFIISIYVSMYFVTRRYNLQTLMNTDFTVTNINGIKYKFRVCSALTDNTCGINIGIIFHETILYVL